MPSNRDRVRESLAQSAAPPALRRGAGVTLSTDPTNDVQTPESVNAITQERAKAEMPERTSRGFAIRTDLVKALKRVALDDDKKLYEVLEEAVEQYLVRRGGNAGNT